MTLAFYALFFVGLTNFASTPARSPDTLNQNE